MVDLQSKVFNQFHIQDNLQSLSFYLTCTFHLIIMVWFKKSAYIFSLKTETPLYVEDLV